MPGNDQLAPEQPPSRLSLMLLCDACGSLGADLGLEGVERGGVEEGDSWGPTRTERVRVARLVLARAELELELEGFCRAQKGQTPERTETCLGLLSLSLSLSLARAMVKTE